MVCAQEVNDWLGCHYRSYGKGVYGLVSDIPKVECSEHCLELLCSCLQCLTDFKGLEQQQGCSTAQLMYFNLHCFTV